MKQVETTQQSGKCHKRVFMYGAIDIDDTCTFLLKAHSIAVQLTDSQPLTLLKFHNHNNQLLLLFSVSLSLFRTD